MTRRYYVSELPAEGGTVELSPAEAQHAIRVMRVAVGDAVMLFDGWGREASAIIQSAGRKECICVIESLNRIERELDRSLHLAIALPKPDRAREMIERLTEIGVAKVTPIVAQHTQRPPTESLMEKLRRSVIEASKQCGRNRLLEIASPVPSVDFFQTNHDGQRWIADPSRDAQELRFDFITTDTIVAVIGPEGGFSRDEVCQAIANGFKPIVLGNRIYRVETAAAVIASVVSVGGNL